MQIERLNALLNMETAAPQPKKPGASPSEPSFAQALQEALDQVEQDLRAADDAARRMAAGQVESIAEVMIASERANLSLGLAVQVRNKLLEAYQEIMRMQL